MANDKKMDVVILGFLNHEPMSGYDIKKRIDNELKYFFNGSFGSIYPALNSLEMSGSVSKIKDENTGRGKITYQITEKGRENLLKWIKETESKDSFRYETLLKIFFGGAVGKIEIIKLINNFREKVKSNLCMLELFEKNLMNCIDESEDHLYFMLTVRFGIETYRGHLNWCDYAIEMLEKDN